MRRRRRRLGPCPRDRAAAAAHPATLPSRRDRRRSEPCPAPCRRADSVGANSGRSDLDGEHLDEHDQGPLRDRVGADRRLAPDGGVGGDGRDRGVLRGAEQGQTGHGVEVGSEQVRLEEGVPVLVARLRERRVVEHAGVENEGVEPAEDLDSACQTLRTLRDLRRRRGRTPPLSSSGDIERRGPDAAREGDRCALGTQPLDDRRADPGRASGDDRTQVSGAATCRIDLHGMAHAVTPGERYEPKSPTEVGPRASRSYASPPASAIRGERVDSEGDCRGQQALRLRRQRASRIDRASAERARAAADPLLHRHRLRAARGDDVQRPAVGSRHRHLRSGCLHDRDVSFTFFSVGYIEMARHVTTAGGIYSYTRTASAASWAGHRGRHRRRLHALLGRASTASRPTSPRRASLDLTGFRHGLAYLRVHPDRTPVHHHVLPRRHHRQDPRPLPAGRAGHPDDLLLRGALPGRGPDGILWRP